MESETTIHALWNCSTLDEIWANTLGFEDRNQLGALNIMELLKVTHEKRMNTELMVSVMWTVWHRRNQLRLNASVLPNDQVLQQAKHVLDTFQMNQQSHINHAANRRTQQHVQWHPPPPNCLKLNFDGAIFPELGKAGLGVVVHDSHEIGRA